MVTIVVPEMDAAIGHYVNDWGFSLINDTLHKSGHRWVEISPDHGARLRLVEASNDEQRSVIGRQAGGRVAFFLTVAGFDEVVRGWSENGIEITEPERCERYGRIVVLSDKFGNRWDVIEARKQDAYD